MTTARHSKTRRLGQHFLCDDVYIDQLVEAIAPAGGELIVEIGPGYGALTSGLLASGASVYGIELDSHLCDWLEHNLCHDNLRIFPMDALQLKLNSLLPGAEKHKVVGNLPYRISSPLLLSLLHQSERISAMYFMLQSEVAERLVASPGSRRYGRLSVITQLLCQVDALFDVPPAAFNPPPAVNSTVVGLIPNQQQWYSDPLDGTVNKHEVNFALVEKVVRVAFQQRRKSLSNGLQGLVDGEQLRALDIDPKARAETLTPQQFVVIATAVAAANK